MRSWLEDNLFLVHALYGLSFFSLGLIVSMHPRALSRYRMAQGLWALAVFAFVHAADDLCLILIPVQAGPEASQVLAILRGLRTFLPAFSFAFLLYFGMTLIGSSVSNRLTREAAPWVAPVLAAVWVISLFFYPLILGEADLSAWYSIAESWSHYILGVPGSLSVAVGLLLQVEELRREQLQGQVRSLYAASFCFFIYGLTYALAVPDVPPSFATAVTQTGFLWTIRVPVGLIRAASAFGASICIARLLRIFSIETTRRIAQSEEERAILQERARIARELHDGMLQTLYGVGLGLKELDDRLRERGLDTGVLVSDMTQQVSAALIGMRRAIINLRDDRIPLSGLVPAVRTCVEQVSRLAKTPILLKSEGFDQEPGTVRVPAPVRDYLLALLREGLSNAVRHAGASQISVMLALQEDTIVLRVTDDGVGFDPAAVLKDGSPTHYGLRNLASRTEQMGGTLRIDSAPGKGTRLLFYIPVPDDQEREKVTS